MFMLCHFLKDGRKPEVMALVPYRPWMSLAPMTFAVFRYHSVPTSVVCVATTGSLLSPWCAAIHYAIVCVTSDRSKVIERVWVFVIASLYAHRHQNILGAAGHIIPTPANQLMVVGLKYGHCPIRVSNQGPFDLWPNAPTNWANRAHSERQRHLTFGTWPAGMSNIARATDPYTLIHIIHISTYLFIKTSAHDSTDVSRR
jgi:hypothetical protein